MVGFWATLSLNIPDFTRYAKSQRAQILGQAIGLPTSMTLFAFVGVVVTSATAIVFGQTIWDPVVLAGKFESPRPRDVRDARGRASRRWRRTSPPTS